MTSGPSGEFRCQRHGGTTPLARFLSKSSDDLKECFRLSPQSLSKNFLYLDNFSSHGIEILSLYYLLLHWEENWGNSVWALLQQKLCWVSTEILSHFPIHSTKYLSESHTSRIMEQQKLKNCDRKKHQQKIKTTRKNTQVMLLIQLLWWALDLSLHFLEATIKKTAWLVSKFWLRGQPYLLLRGSEIFPSFKFQNFSYNT